MGGGEQPSVASRDELRRRLDEPSSLGVELGGLDELREEVNGCAWVWMGVDRCGCVWMGVWGWASVGWGRVTAVVGSIFSI